MRLVLQLQVWSDGQGPQGVWHNTLADLRSYYWTGASSCLGAVVGSIVAQGVGANNQRFADSDVGLYRGGVSEMSYNQLTAKDAKSAKKSLRRAIGWGAAKTSR